MSPTDDVLEVGETNANCRGVSGSAERRRRPAPGRLCVYITLETTTSNGLDPSTDATNSRSASASLRVFDGRAGERNLV